MQSNVPLHALKFKQKILKCVINGHSNCTAVSFSPKLSMATLCND